MTLESTHNRSSLNNTIIRGREYILDHFAGSDLCQTLNHYASEGSSYPSEGLAAKLKLTLDVLKTTAMDEASTRVDYATLRSSSAYVEYRETCLSQLQQFNPQQLPTVYDRRAFWINLYNALVIDAVIAFDVQDSVTGGVLGPLAFFRRAAYTVAGRRVSLDDIEHGILRTNLGHPLLSGPHFPSDDPRMEWVLPLDPRVHFALNCAARSCPPIRSYAAGKLSTHLDLAAQSFVNTTVTIRQGKIYLPELFHWYRGDFGGRQGVLHFLIQYLEDDRRPELLSMRNGELRFRYTPNDWSLNVL